MFITFEGVEGSGKTTQIKILNDMLTLRGFQTLLTREPGGTPIGDKIREVLLHSDNSGMVPLCELLMYAAGRAQHIQQVITPALKARKIVLCDRFTDATMAYQGYGRGFSQAMINDINRLAAGDLKPDLTFLLDCDPKTGLTRTDERRAIRKIPLDEDRFENEPLVFHNKVRGGYLEIARRDPDRIKIVNASQNVEDMHHEIAREVLKVLGN